MSMYYCKKTRRQFLVGAGKSLLALPLLPSLLSREAQAQTAVAARRLMLFWFDHLTLSELWPNRAAATSVVGTSGARQSLLSSLGSASSISPVLSNSRYSSIITRNQMSILRGFETSIIYGPVHNNFAMAAGQSIEGSHPTIDSIIEASRTVYPTSTPAGVRKALRVNFNGGQFFYQRVGGNIQGLPDYNGSEITTFYNEVFSSLTGGTVPVQDLTNQMKSNILNRVHSAFTSFRSGRKISADDRSRLDQHMDYVSDLQRNYASVMPPVVNSCARPSAPPAGAGSNPAQYSPIYMDLLAVAFKCGLSKFGTMAFESDDPRWIPSLDINNQSMHAVMHGDFGQDLKLRAYRNWWTYHMNMIADRFIAPLDEQEGNTGRTYLDNMATALICAGGCHTLNQGDGGHNGWDSQQILLGSMGGRLRSGNYTVMPRTNGRDFPYNTFLITLMQLMGVPSGEYSAFATNQQGFGSYSGFEANHPFTSRFYQPITEVLT